MCPDQQLLSVYLDGELPSPWKEKMESHLSECTKCAQRLERYKALFAGDNAALGENAFVEAAKERVWRRLESRQMRPLYQNSGSDRSPSIWQRRISIPLPAAAAAVLLLFLSVFLVQGRRSDEPPDMAVTPNMVLTLDEALPGAVPASDMSGVLQYLGGFDSGDILILRLPESRNFISSGEPAIVRAADYSRSRP
ncbi:MAG: zf-HC2 domain-containing protein [Treponema sp.]|nr:zf-HC2 domain-containing protein [Treponema sp.]